MDLDPPNLQPPGQGKLLISEPYLADPYFRRTVVLLCAHDDQGSFGFVLNRFVDMDISDLLEGIPDQGARVGIGGPVQSNNLYYLHTLGDRLPGSIPVFADIFMGGDVDALRNLVSMDPDMAYHIRFFVGYSGWEGEQLQREVDERSWLITHADRDLVMGTKQDGLWADALRTMGGEYAALANFPDDPSLN